MNELVHIPSHLLPQTTFKTASEYFLVLAEMHMTHLSMQRNDAIESAKDCRRKYIARCLFRKLARVNRLSIDVLIITAFLSSSVMIQASKCTWKLVEKEERTLASWEDEATSTVR